MNIKLTNVTEEQLSGAIDCARDFNKSYIVGPIPDRRLFGIMNCVVYSREDSVLVSGYKFCIYHTKTGIIVRGSLK